MSFAATAVLSALSHSLLLQKLNDHGLSDGYMNWIPNYLADSPSHIRYSGALLLLFHVMSMFCEDPFGVIAVLCFIDDLCTVINFF
jgi:hypothetical protein